MVEGGMVYPPVFVVDGQAGYPLPPSPRPHRGRAAQWVLYLLVSLALCGMAVEACFIYYLYTTTRALCGGCSVCLADCDITSPFPPSTMGARVCRSDIGRMGKIFQDRREIEALPTKRTNLVLKPSKPTAHLSVGMDLPRTDGILLWNLERDSFIHELEYREGGLEVQKEGYYYIYSKVFFTEPRCSMFTHTVLRRTMRYPEEALALMESKRLHCQHTREQKAFQNSYLGGVFHLFKGDTLLVRAKNHTLIARQFSYDNFFGVFMI